MGRWEGKRNEMWRGKDRQKNWAGGDKEMAWLRHSERRAMKERKVDLSGVWGGTTVTGKWVTTEIDIKGVGGDVYIGLCKRELNEWQ